ncbi:MAG: cell filamentation protein Fic [Acidobacteria bacterium]|nr:cell filamentation protein Fic [Acidobacteriota bacterium]
MSTPNERLAASLDVLRRLQQDGRRVFESGEFSRLHRKRLLQNGFLQEVMKGWLIFSGPGVREGDSTPWYASFWEFCARYCEARFEREWRLSPEQSILLHAENTVVPAQVVVHSPKGANNKIDLPFGASLYDLKDSRTPPASDLTVRDGLRLFSPAAALVRVSESFIRRNPVETQVALASVADASEILRRLLTGGHSVVAGRLAGAFRRIERADVAEEILQTMQAAGHDVRENDPFAPEQPAGALPDAAPPIVSRLRAMWSALRKDVLEAFPDPPGLPTDKGAYLGFVEDIYQSDAYHSLSIEGYRVSPALIERVASGGWDPQDSEADRESRDALAARGYWQAFRLVQDDVVKIVSGAEPADLVRKSHRAWYRELFQPCVVAGLINASALAGYRNEAVYLRTSRFVPPRWEVVRDAMGALFDLLEQEPEPGVRAVLGHWLFGYVHPYPDGNGRMARFLMNAMLASGGYPWTVIRVDGRTRYLTTLDSASIEQDIRPFARFVADQVQRSGRR